MFNKRKEVIIRFEDMLEVVDLKQKIEWLKKELDKDMLPGRVNKLEHRLDNIETQLNIMLEQFNAIKLKVLT